MYVYRYTWNFSDFSVNLIVTLPMLFFGFFFFKVGNDRKLK